MQQQDKTIADDNLGRCFSDLATDIDSFCFSDLATDIDSWDAF